jgi:hypothetical protein
MIVLRLYLSFGFFRRAKMVLPLTGPRPQGFRRFSTKRPGLVENEIQSTSKTVSSQWSPRYPAMEPTVVDGRSGTRRKRPSTGLAGLRQLSSSYCISSTAASGLFGTSTSCPRKGPRNGNIATIPPTRLTVQRPDSRRATEIQEKQKSSADLRDSFKSSCSQVGESNTHGWIERCMVNWIKRESKPFMVTAIGKKRNWNGLNG